MFGRDAAVEIYARRTSKATRAATVGITLLVGGCGTPDIQQATAPAHRTNVHQATGTTAPQTPATTAAPQSTTTTTLAPVTTTTIGYPATGPIPACSSNEGLPFAQIPLANGAQATFIWDRRDVQDSYCFTLKATDGGAFPQAVPCQPNGTFGFPGPVGPLTYYTGQAEFLAIQFGRPCVEGPPAG